MQFNRLLLFIFICITPIHWVYAGKKPKKPRLIVGIVVDQMRYDFLYRYWEFYGKRGIKRLVTKGYSFEQAHYPYGPTVTGPGHASIYTGTTPAFHGIAGNNWYDRDKQKTVYCASNPDTTVKGLGQIGRTGQMSPKRLLTTTLGDELKFASRGRSKVIGIALKDRGAILPAGHRADAAYWFDSKSGTWVSSTYYFAALPGWVHAFNTSGSISQYVKQSWAPLLPASAYKKGAGTDTSRFEGQITAGAGNTMPVDFPKLFKGSYELVAASSLGNIATTDFAISALNNEKLGKREGETDLLAISFSSTDLVGHIYGPDSWECMDAYLRLDQQLERLLDEIDKSVGIKNTLIFLSADHGVAQIPGLAKSQSLPAGRFSMREAVKVANARLLEKYRDSAIIVLDSLDEQLYLNRPLLREKRISLDEASAVVAEAVRALPWVQNAWGAWALKAAAVTDPFARRLALGCHPDRSGDVFILPKPGYIEGNRPTGTTHSSTYPYDTHVPMLFYGWGIKPGESVEEVSITDIAPTLAALLKIQMPSATTGKAHFIKRKR